MKKVLVDTSVWSEALRRKKGRNQKLTSILSELIEESRAVIAGPIRQEILSGISDKNQFERIRETLQAFDEIKIESINFELAASLNNRCRAKGIQGSHIDFLLCAIAITNDLEIFTMDKDFDHYKKYIDIKLYRSR